MEFGIVCIMFVFIVWLHVKYKAVAIKLENAKSRSFALKNQLIASRNANTLLDGRLQTQTAHNMELINSNGKIHEKYDAVIRDISDLEWEFLALSVLYNHRDSQYDAE